MVGPHACADQVTQSSVYNGLGPELAIDGDASGDGEWACIHTQREKQPWWQLDLGQNASIEKIVIWNRNDIPFDRSQKADAITKRLFPSWVIVSQHEFQQECVPTAAAAVQLLLLPCVPFTPCSRVAHGRPSPVWAPT